MGIQDRDFRLWAISKISKFGKIPGIGNGDQKLRKNIENPESWNLNFGRLILNSEGVLFISVTFSATDKEAEHKKSDF